MISSIRRSASRRGVTLFAATVAAVFTVSARPPAPGITFRMRMVVTPPEMPGMAMGQTVIVGHGAAIGAQSRFDFDSVTGQVPITIGDYVLSLDSGRVVSVRPSSKTYSEGMPMMAALPMEIGRAHV